MGEASAALGVFDSGVGGLTVVRRLIERLPREAIFYLGDTARVPYGTKSAGTVTRYARACARVLLERGIKLMVVACNTASVYALEALQADLDVPVLGVVEPGARAAVRATHTGRIGVIGTVGTIHSGRYQGVIAALAPDVKVFCKPCPLFVPLAEEGRTEGPVPTLIAKEYLGELTQEGIDTLILGCTHYPLLRKVIAEVVGNGVALVDSAEAMTEEVAKVLQTMGLNAKAPAHPEHRFLVTDAPDRFAQVGRRFLGAELGQVEWVDL
jgi:glutamate racemase